MKTERWLAENCRFAAAATRKWRVEWVNPETNKWETYQEGLSRARAERLAMDVEYVMSPRWFGKHAPAKAVPMLAEET